MPNFTLSTYKRKITLLSTDRLSTVATLCDLSTGTNHVTNAEFDLQRLGGCGAGTITLAKKFDYSTIENGMWVQMSYADTPWYLGRVDGIDFSHPSGVTVSLQGMMSLLSDYPVGGYGSNDITGPQVIGLKNYYNHDPDFADQTFTPTTDYGEALSWVITNYLTPLGIGTGTIDEPDTPISFYSMTFSGESSVAEVLRVIAESVYNASYGVDGSGNFFFHPVSEGITNLDGYALDAGGSPITPQESYQLGVSVAEGAQATKGRSVFYNRVQLIGGFVYGDNTQPSGYFRYTAFGYDDTYADLWGYRTARISVPFIRNDATAYQWMDQFFKKYGGPRTRYTFTTYGQGATLVTPWGGPIELKNQAGTRLVLDLCDEIHVSFNEAPYYTITTGPEDLQYPEADVQDAEEKSSQGSSGGDNANIPTEECPSPPCETVEPPEDICNAEHEFTPTGTPTAGTLTITYTVGGTTTAIDIPWDAIGFEIEAAIADQHAQVAMDDVQVIGTVPGGFTVYWKGKYANKGVAVPTVDFSALDGVTDYAVEEIVDCGNCACGTTPVAPQPIADVCPCDTNVPGVVTVDCLNKPVAYRWQPTGSLPWPFDGTYEWSGYLTYSADTGDWRSEVITVACVDPYGADDDPYTADENTYQLVWGCTE